MKRSCLFAFVLLIGVASAGHAQHGGGVSVALPAVTAPQEARQFDFLLGHWEVELTPKVNGLVAMIHGAPHLVGTWKAWRAFDGFGLDDELRIVDGSGNPVSLSHVSRIYDKAAGLWRISGLDVYRARFSAATAVWKDGQMQVNGSGIGSDGKPYLSRTLFHDIGPNAFSMQQDRSVDDGATWDEAALRITARRLAASAPR